MRWRKNCSTNQCNQLFGFLSVKKNDPQESTEDPVDKEVEFRFVCITNLLFGKWRNLMGWRPQFLIYFRLPRAQADGKGQAVEEKARVEKLGSENSARREPNRSTCSLGESLLDPLGLNTWSQGPRFVWDACWPADPGGGGRFNRANHKH